ncbi:MAG: type IV secretion system DNA-binding domain-containing protein [Eubacterium sp.]|nr:type IV secretion system DNA-binding domain-containing protein [Eubacterium sp.]
MVKTVFEFSGLWAAPLGALIGFVLVYAKRVILDPVLTGRQYTVIADWQIVAISVAFTVLMILTANIRRYIRGERSYGPIRKRKAAYEISEDKTTAQHRPIPKRFLSRTPDGLTVGQLGHGRYVRIPFLRSPLHQIIYGAPGSNKTTVILNSLIWNFNFAKVEERMHAVFGLDVKPDISIRAVDETEVYILNPSEMHSVGFDPYFGLDKDVSDDDVYTRMHLIARALIKQAEKNVFFSENARKLLTGFLTYFFYKDIDFPSAISEILTIPTEDLIAQIISDPDVTTHTRIHANIRSFEGKTSDAMQDISMTLMTSLSIFMQESVVSFFSSDNIWRIDPSVLLAGRSVFLAIPDHLLTTYADVFRMVISLTMTFLLSVPESETKNNNPIWFLLDEVGNVGPIPDLAHIMATGRSKKIAVTLVLQSYSQLEDTYGVQTARTISQTARTHIVFSCSDIQSAERFSKWAGEYDERKTSKQLSGNSVSTESISEEHRRVLDVSDIYSLEERKEVLVYTEGTWFTAPVAPYYKIPLLYDKSKELVSRNEIREPVE